MSAKEMYDYLSSVAPDITDVFSVNPSQVQEASVKNQKINPADDLSEEVISLSGNSVIFDVSLNWNNKNESDAGTIFDFWNDPSKANGMEKKFTWKHPTDGHYYVAAFRSAMKRLIRFNTIFKFPTCLLRVFGKLDAQYYVEHDGETTDFTVGNTLTDNDSGATATIEAIDRVNRRIFLTNIAVSTFDNTDEVTDGSETANLTCDQTALY